MAEVFLSARERNGRVITVFLFSCFDTAAFHSEKCARLQLRKRFKPDRDFDLQTAINEERIILPADF